MQKLALTKLTASTWGARYIKARYIYNIVIRPLWVYRATVWYYLKGIKEHRQGCIIYIIRVQNECLKKIIRGFKITPTRLLKIEVGIPLIKVYLEVILLAATTKKKA